MTATAFEPTTNLVCLASLAKFSSIRLQTKWLWIQIQLHSLKFQISHLFQAIMRV